MRTCVYPNGKCVRVASHKSHSKNGLPVRHHCTLGLRRVASAELVATKPRGPPSRILLTTLQHFFETRRNLKYMYMCVAKVDGICEPRKICFKRQ